MGLKIHGRAIARSAPTPSRDRTNVQKRSKLGDQLAKPSAEAPEPDGANPPRLQKTSRAPLGGAPKRIHAASGTICGVSGCASTAQVTSGGRTHSRRLLVELDSFYEKVVKVKADVAAILKFFLPMPQDRGRPSRGGPGGTHRGDAQGGFQRSALKPLLRG